MNNIVAKIIPAKETDVIAGERTLTSSEILSVAKTKICFSLLTRLNVQQPNLQYRMTINSFALEIVKNHIMKIIQIKSAVI